jgi:hypothetical protein
VEEAVGVYVGSEGLWEIPVLSTQFCSECETPVKKKKCTKIFLSIE